MLSKPATIFLGLIREKPLNAYEMIKQLSYMNIKWWFNIGDSTVYTTLKTLEKRGMIAGTVEKVGNMPDRTVYTITANGDAALRDTLRKSILQFDYDTNIFTIAAFFIDVLDTSEKKELLERRLDLLQRYLMGIQRQVTPQWKGEVLPAHAANVERMMGIIEAEISGTEKLLSACLGEAK